MRDTIDPDVWKGISQTALFSLEPCFAKVAAFVKQAFFMCIAFSYYLLFPQYCPKPLRENHLAFLLDQGFR